MNYIEQINLLWQTYEEHLLSPADTTLYFHLLDISNKCNWTNPFRRRNTVICAHLRISAPTLKTSRNKLKQVGLIDFESKGKGDNNIKYMLVPANIKERKNVKYFTTNDDTLLHTSINTNEPHNINLNNKPKHFDEAVEYLGEIDLNSNASFDPQRASLPDERKKVAPKKELPTMEVALSSICDSAYWRNVVEHHKQSEADRQALFKTFYEQREDHYLVKYPSKTEMAQHFYNWVPIHLSKDKLKKLNGNAISKSANLGNTATVNRSNKDKRAELLSLNQQSSEFLRRIDH